MQLPTVLVKFYFKTIILQRMGFGQVTTAFRCWEMRQGLGNTETGNCGKAWEMWQGLGNVWFDKYAIKTGKYLAKIKKCGRNWNIGLGYAARLLDTNMDIHVTLSNTKKVLDK